MRGVAAATLLASAHAATLEQTPISRVVGLITELKAKVESDGKSEQQSYDKYACWCENTLARKASNINDAKETIEKLQTEIEKLNGDLGAHGAQISQLTKDLAQNAEAQKEANEVRDKEYHEYENDKVEAEQCLGALEQAIKVMTGAGAGKKGFLETMQEAQLLSVVAGVRGVLDRPIATEGVSDSDLALVKKFINSPENFVGGRTAMMSAAQIAQNPYGDYAPQSSAIQGILKGMYDSFAADLEKDNAQEADRQKAFEELMATKKAEQATLQATLEKQSHDEAHKSKSLSDAKTQRDDTDAQMRADEIFFEDTKDACKVKASEWAERCRLRTEELTGISKAIQILSSSDASQTFHSSGTTFVQLKSMSSKSHSYRLKAYNTLKLLSLKYTDRHMGKLAVAVKMGGHFDKIIAMIDQMIATLRKEETEDISHRDRCQNSQGKNSNDMADLEHDIEKSAAQLERMGDSETELKATIKSLEEQIGETKTNLEELLTMRNSESEAFKQALKDDADAVDLIAQAVVSLTKFYKSNKIPLALAQKREDPKYAVDEDKAPETSFSGGDYGGRKGESGGIIAILEMLKEDTENEMKTSRADDAEAQADYEKQRGALDETLNAQTNSKVAAEQELAGVQEDIADSEEFKDSKASDLAEEQKLEASLGKDCAWVENNFDSRREKRKNEMDGLVEAKNALAGVGQDDDDELM
jgi:chromosome segregation ATPase